MLAAATIALLPLTCMIERPWESSPGFATVTALLALALVSTAAGYVVYFRIFASLAVIDGRLFTRFAGGRIFRGQRLVGRSRTEC